MAIPARLAAIAVWLYFCALAICLISADQLMKGRMQLSFSQLLICKAAYWQCNKAVHKLIF